MKKYFLVVLALILFVPLWAKQSKHKRKKNQANAIQSVMLYHTPCYGRCPTYSIEINADGLITYTGIRFVKDTGVYTKKIDVNKSSEILNKLNSNRVDTCRKMYEARIPDLPGIFFVINYKDSVKKINSASNGPRFLMETANAIDTLGKKTDDGWLKK